MDYQPRLNALATVVLLLAATSQGQITLNPSSSVPSGASPTVNPAFAAYAFEERSFYSYSGMYGISTISRVRPPCAPHGQMLEEEREKVEVQAISNTQITVMDRRMSLGHSIKSLSLFPRVLMSR